MTINDINTLSNLKKYGSFVEVKKTIRDNCEFNMKTRSWEALFEKLQNIKIIVNNKTLIVDKHKISKELGIDDYTNGTKQLSGSFDKLIIFFTIKSFDPYKEYEKRKVLDFKYSSRLEGIDIGDDTQARDNILKKYKVIIDG